MSEVKIIYGGFWDFPLAFAASYENVQYLFYREWDDELDDYEDEYDVFILPNLSEDEIKRNWALALEKAKPFGKIPVKQVVFDSTHRLIVDTVTFDRIITRNYE
jgi:hypothetical protein